MRGMIVVITAFMSIIFLKRKQYRHHWLGVVLILIGVGSVGVVSVISSKKHPDEDDPSSGSELLGIGLLLISQCFTGCQFITEEKILGNYYLDPF